MKRQQPQNNQCKANKMVTNRKYLKRAVLNRSMILRDQIDFFIYLMYIIYNFAFTQIFSDAFFNKFIKLHAHYLLTLKLKKHAFSTTVNCQKSFQKSEDVLLILAFLPK